MKGLEYKEGSILSFSEDVLRITSSGSFIKDCGEPVKFNDIGSAYCFICFNDCMPIGISIIEYFSGFILWSYDYVLPEFRCNGIYAALHSSKENYSSGGKVKSQIKEGRLERFINSGFKVVSKKGQWLTIERG